MGGMHACLRHKLAAQADYKDHVCNSPTDTEVTVCTNVRMGILLLLAHNLKTATAVFPNHTVCIL